MEPSGTGMVTPRLPCAELFTWTFSLLVTAIKRDSWPKSFAATVPRKCHFLVYSMSDNRTFTRLTRYPDRDRIGSTSMRANSATWVRRNCMISAMRIGKMIALTCNLRMSSSMEVSFLSFRRRRMPLTSRLVRKRNLPYEREVHYR